MILSLEHIFYKYPHSEKLVLNDISFTVKKGSYVSVLGENGSGKTTLIKLILKLLTPMKGSITCNANRIGYVPQQKPSFYSLPLTVSELLSVAQKVHSSKPHLAKDHATKTGKSLKQKRESHTIQGEKPIITISTALNLLGVDNKANSLLSSLSGGELQRVFIAQAILANPDLLILDEPSTAVDSSGQEILYQTISNLHRSQGITIIAIEHNLPMAMHNSTEIFHLAEGSGHLCTPHQYTKEYLDTAKLNTLSRSE